jgi:hypothetical protein
MTNDEWRMTNGSSLDLQPAFGEKERYRRTAVRRFVASLYLEGAHRRTAVRRFVASL